MGRYRGLGRDTIEETTRLTIDDLRTWGFLSKTPGERSGTITLSRNGEHGSYSRNSREALGDIYDRCGIRGRQLTVFP